MHCLMCAKSVCAPVSYHILRAYTYIRPFFKQWPLSIMHHELHAPEKPSKQNNNKADNMWHLHHYH